jgi:hypothetical protein
MLLRVNQEAAAKKQREEDAAKAKEARRLAAEEAGEDPPEEEEPAEEEAQEELDEEARIARDEAELEGLHGEWSKNVLSEHLVYIKGVELVYFEFKELLLELALRLKDYVDAAPGKLRSLVKKFLDELFLKRLKPYIKFVSNKAAPASISSENAAAVRSWPESEKDKKIKAI